MFRRMAVLAGMVGATVLLATGSAVASTGRTYYSPDQAGYAVTGAHFKVVEVRVTLPDASHYAREIGDLGLGVQLWSTATVVDLRVEACTDYTCKPGGRGVTRRYQPVLRIFSRATGSLICSTRAKTCVSTPSSWNRVRFSPGKTVDIALFYDHTNGLMDASVDSGSTGVDYVNYSLGSGVTFSQARIAAEFGLSPWNTVPFRRPSSPIKLAKFWEPATAPYEAELATTGGSSGCVAGRWMRHRVKLTSNGTSSRPLKVQPGSLWNNGCDFNVYIK